METTVLTAEPELARRIGEVLFEELSHFGVTDRKVALAAVEAAIGRTSEGSPYEWHTPRTPRERAVDALARALLRIGRSEGLGIETGAVVVRALLTEPRSGRSGPGGD